MIKTKAAVNEDPTDALMRDLKEQNELIKRQLAEGKMHVPEIEEGWSFQRLILFWAIVCFDPWILSTHKKRKPSFNSVCISRRWHQGSNFLKMFASQIFIPFFLVELKELKQRWQEEVNCITNIFIALLAVPFSFGTFTGVVILSEP